MRRTTSLVAILSLSALGLVGCSSASTDASCERVTSDSSALDLVTVTGDVADAPDVSIDAPLYVDDTVYTDVATGSGTPVTTADQDIVFDISVYNATTGDAIVRSAYDGDLSKTIFPLSRWTQAFPGLEDVLMCATPGTRTVAVLAPDDIAPDMATSLALGADDSAVLVVDLHKVYLAAANGTDQYNDKPGMPTVVRAPDGRPGIIVPDAAPPTDVVVQVLKKGDGEKVTGDAPVRVQYTGLTWSDRTVFETTWDTMAQPVSLDAVVPGFAQALEGQTVGSQVLVVIPPDQGYGDKAQGDIPAGSTLVFVIDILGIDPPAAP